MTHIADRCQECGYEALDYLKKSNTIVCKHCGYTMRRGNRPQTYDFDFGNGSGGVDDFLNPKTKRVYMHYHVHDYPFEPEPAHFERPEIFDRIEEEARLKLEKEKRMEEERVRKIRAKHKNGIALLSNLQKNESGESDKTENAFYNTIKKQIDKAPFDRDYFEALKGSIEKHIKDEKKKKELYKMIEKYSRYLCQKTDI